MKRLAVGVLVAVSCNLYGQKSVEVGILVGGSAYDGDLSPVPYNKHHFATGLIGRYNINDFFSLKGSVLYGSVSAADSSTNIEWRQIRNLSFKTNIFEFSAQLEWNLLGYDPIGKKGRRFSPYAFSGIAVYKYNPQAYLNGEWIELQPLGTEGQGTTPFQDRKKYKLTQFAIPFGAGLKVRLAQKWTLGLEYGIRMTFNDYLDDVSKTYVQPQILEAANGGPNNNSVLLSDRSPEEVRNARPYDPLTFVGPARGDADDNDWYSFGGITLTYTIFGGRVKCFQF